MFWLAVGPPAVVQLLFQPRGQLLLALLPTYVMWSIAVGYFGRPEEDE